MWKKWFDKMLKVIDTVTKKGSILEIIQLCSFKIIIHGTITFFKCLKGYHGAGDWGRRKRTEGFAFPLL